MWPAFRIFVLMALLMVVAVPCYADSPVTSTTFSDAYMDIEMVKKAQSVGKMTEEIADFLSSPDNPIDIKAAVINALYNSNVWDIKNNADIYSGLVFGKPVSELNLNSMSGEDLFCLGYLILLDDYFNPEKAMPVLKKAIEKRPESFTVSMIYMLAKSDKEFFDGGDGVWENIESVLLDKSLKRELRPGAVDIITDYMSLYRDENVQDKPGYTIEVIHEVGILKVRINGVYIQTDVAPRIINGRVLIPARAVLEALGAKVSWNGEMEQVIVERENTSLLLRMNQSTALLNGKTIEMDVEPMLINSRVMIPLRFVGESLGCEVIWIDIDNLGC